MEQMEMSVKTEPEAAATSPAHCDSENPDANEQQQLPVASGNVERDGDNLLNIGVNFIKQEPGLLQSVKSEPSFTNDALLKEGILLDSSPDGSEKQCVHDASTPVRTGGVNETCSTSLGNMLNVKYESVEMDIGPTVLQHLDSHYTIYKNMSAATEENAIVVDFNEAIPGGGVKKENIEDDCEQQCVHVASAQASAGGVNETCSTSLGDLLNVKYESAEMDIGPTVLQHMDSRYTLHKNMSAATEKNAVVVDWNEAMPGCGVKKENIEDEWRDDEATSHNCNQTTIEVDYDEAHVNSNPGQQKDLQKHLLHQHRICEKGYSSKADLNLHKRSHSSVELTDHLVNYESHHAQHGDFTKKVGVQTGVKAYQCKICDAWFARNGGLIIHMRVHTGEKPYQCKICDAKFARSGHLTRHMIVHMGEKPYQCKICDARFAEKFSLTQHVRVHTGEKPYQCKICDAKFATNGYLTRHARVHTGEKPYQCKICDAKFIQNKSLIQHVRVHTGEKPYRCNICDARFAENFYLTQHIRVHTGEKPYQCKVCDARFARNSGLKQHVRCHTGVKPYQCKICDARFARNSGLSIHVRVHTGEKPYQCKICDASFTQNINLTQHMTLHTGEKPCKCKVCGERFATYGYLSRHMRVHVGENNF